MAFMSAYDRGMAKQPDDDEIRPEVAAVIAAIQKLQDRRNELNKEQQKVDRDLQNLRIQIDGLFENSEQKKRGTEIMIELLQRNHSVMKSSDLAREAVKRGVKSPHSSIQSLIKRKAIRLSGGKIELLI